MLESLVVGLVPITGVPEDETPALAVLVALPLAVIFVVAPLPWEFRLPVALEYALVVPVAVAARLGVFVGKLFIGDKTFDSIDGESICVLCWSSKKFRSGASSQFRSKGNVAGVFREDLLFPFPFP